MEDFLKQLEEPFQLELSLKHLDGSPLQFALSESEIAVTYELVRTEMTARSVCEAARRRVARAGTPIEHLGI